MALASHLSLHTDGQFASTTMVESPSQLSDIRKSLKWKHPRTPVEIISETSRASYPTSDLIMSTFPPETVLPYLGLIWPDSHGYIPIGRYRQVGSDRTKRITASSKSRQVTSDIRFLYASVLLQKCTCHSPLSQPKTHRSSSGFNCGSPSRPSTSQRPAFCMLSSWDWTIPLCPF